MKRLTSGGGWPAVRYALRTARQSGGLIKFFKAMSTHNACKTCALGMGGQRGGMVDESGHFPEVCKKSMQAMAADMQGGIDSAFFAKFNFAQLSQLTPRDLEHLGRLVDPLYAGPDDDRFRPIDWEQANKRFADTLQNTQPSQSFFYVSGRSSNEAAFLLQLFARLYGTNNVNNCSYYCHQASGVGMSQSLGTGTATVVLEDLDRCDLFVLIGGNPASNHPRLMRRLMNIRRRGGDVVVINPMRETGLVRFSVPSDVRSLLFSSDIASLYVQPHIGGDLALLSGIAKRIDEIDAADEGFIDQCTTGSGEFREHLRTLTWENIEASSGVDAQTIDRIAKLYSASSHTIFGWTMGITHHLNGVENVRAIANLALMRGMVGKPGAGLLPIRGHSNVQGIGSVGVTPALKQAFFENLERRFDVKLPTSKGLDTLSCIEAALEGKLSTAICLGGNLYGASPDASRCKKALNRLENIVYLSTTLNTGHMLGRAKHTLILPVLARDEEPQSTTQESMFNYVRLSEGGPARHAGPKSEVEVLAQLARTVLGDQGPIDWHAMEQHHSIRQSIAAIVPGYEKISSIGDNGKEFQLAGRTYHQPRFNTPTSRANFCVSRWQPSTKSAKELTLMTIRSEGQFNTVVYEEADIYRHQDRRDVILMNEADMLTFGLLENQRVTVTSAVGQMAGVLVRSFDIRAGNAAMYFPEANMLVPFDADKQSRTPAYKAVRITLSPTP